MIITVWENDQCQILSTPQNVRVLLSHCHLYIFKDFDCTRTLLHAHISYTIQLITKLLAQVVSVYSSMMCLHGHRHTLFQNNVDMVLFCVYCFRYAHVLCCRYLIILLMNGIVLK